MDTEQSTTVEQQTEPKDFFAGIVVPENMHQIMDMHLELMETERKFRRACEQIVTLNGRMAAMKGRYERAKQENRRSFRYTLRLQLAVVEGVKNVYYDYAQFQAEKINKLRQELYGEETQGGDSSDEMDIPEFDDAEGNWGDVVQTTGQLPLGAWSQLPGTSATSWHPSRPPSA